MVALMQAHCLLSKYIERMSAAFDKLFISFLKNCTNSYCERRRFHPKIMPGWEFSPDTFFPRIYGFSSHLVLQCLQILSYPGKLRDKMLFYIGDDSFILKSKTFHL